MDGGTNRPLQRAAIELPDPARTRAETDAIHRRLVPKRGRMVADRKAITVPGEFFDVDPGRRRLGRFSRFRQHVRFSFGPTLDDVELARDRLGQMVAES